MFGFGNKTEGVNSVDENALKTFLEAFSLEAIKKFKEEVVAQGSDYLETEISKLTVKAARRAHKVAQKWCKWSEDGPILMPDNTRLYYRRSNIEVVVQEFAPQIRLMRFVGSLAKRVVTDGNIPEVVSEGTANSIYSYSLSLPYMVFIHRFQDGILNKTLVTFNNRPLQHLEEKPYMPYLSNISNDLRLCHGQQYITSQLIKGDLTQQIAYTMDHFWNTTYTDEWSQNFWQYAKKFCNDPRINSLDNWQATSLDNPLFVIEDVPWIESTEKSYGQMIVKLFDKDQDSISFQNDLFNDLVDSCFDELKTGFKGRLADIQEAAAKVNIPEHLKKLTEILTK